MIITYKELRQLELAIYQELRKLDTGIYYVPSVNLSQFYGIEIEDFAVDVTRLSLWIAEHQMNKILEEKVDDAVRPLLPLQSAGAIVCGNALRLDWEEVMPHNKDEEVYIFGNPPYLGAKKQTKYQKEDLFLALNKNNKYKKLDYITGWFYKGAVYINNTIAKLGFVTTNSIVQGEQVSMIWNDILSYSNIFFAYQSFKWMNNAKGNAGVTVTVIGLITKERDEKKYLYTSEGKSLVSNISPYLVEGSNQIVQSSKSVINSALPNAFLGSLPLDGGNLILSSQEYEQIISQYPELSRIIKKYIGSKELLNGDIRYVLWMDELSYRNHKMNPFVVDRVTKVYNFRISAQSSAKNCADRPFQFFTFISRNSAIKKHHLLDDSEMNSFVIPRVSSENRLYVPMGIVGEDTVISDSATAIYDAPIWLLGLLQSRMHMVWLKAVGGKLETRYRYSASLVYNTFPVPELSTRRKNEIEDLVLNILDIRDEEGGTLAELYGSPLAEKNPKPMNPRLLKAHQELDEVVDRAYKKSGFKDDNDRLSLLLKMYSEKVKELEGNE